MRQTSESERTQRVEMILQQVESLPTLSPIAMRVLQLASSPDAGASQIAGLIESDPALTARVLALCRRADLGANRSAAGVTTVERAVVMLGLEAVRAAMLSVEVYGLFRESNQPEPGSDDLHPADRGNPSAPPPLNRRELWRHLIGVACAAEMLAARIPAGAHSAAVRCTPQEAFVCGLLHDLGKLALDRLLPRSYARVVKLAEDRQADIAEIERRVIGIDHHTAGKRLGEYWGLPHMLRDVMWLHNRSPEALPDVAHRNVIYLVSLADGIARDMHIGWSGNMSAPRNSAELADAIGLDPRALRDIERSIHDRVVQRCESLGLDEGDDHELLVESIAAANKQLGRLRLIIDERAEVSAQHEKTLAAIAAFHAAALHAASPRAVLGEVIRSSVSLHGGSFRAVLWRSREDEPLLFQRYSASGEQIKVQELPPCPKGASLADLAGSPDVPLTNAGLLGWLSGLLAETTDPETLSRLRLLPLTVGRPTAILVHDGPLPAEGAGLSALRAAWAAALTAAAHHEGAQRFSELLGETNRKLAEAQSQLIESQSMARLGEMAAGAAHEMNNPLTVISGQSQLLAQKLRGTGNAGAARAIVSAAEVLSELIRSLHLFASPPRPRRARTDIGSLVDAAIGQAKRRWSDKAGPETSGADREPAEIRASIDDAALEAYVDAGQMTQALAELLVNALESTPRSPIALRVHVDPLDDRLILCVEDDGAGMSEHALRHAFDPFFSDKPAGRQHGLGLARARRFVELHAGELTLESAPGRGTKASIRLPNWRVPPALQTRNAGRAA